MVVSSSLWIYDVNLERPVMPKTKNARHATEPKDQKLMNVRRYSPWKSRTNLSHRHSFVPNSVLRSILNRLPIGAAEFCEM